MLLRHVWKCDENVLTCVRVFVEKVRIQNIMRMEYVSCCRRYFRYFGRQTSVLIVVKSGNLKR